MIYIRAVDLLNQLNFLLRRFAKNMSTYIHRYLHRLHVPCAVEEFINVDWQDKIGTYLYA